VTRNDDDDDNDNNNIKAKLLTRVRKTSKDSYSLRKPGSSVSIVRAGRPGDRCSIPGRGESIFRLVPVSRPALGPTQPPVQWVQRSFSRGWSRSVV
jgi:hypothetical protein